MRELRAENRLKSQSFQAVFDILSELNDTEAKVLETLFFYKVGSQDEFDVEAREVT
jgi:hypothetical protein